MRFVFFLGGDLGFVVFGIFLFFKGLLFRVRGSLLGFVFSWKVEFWFAVDGLYFLFFGFVCLGRIGYAFRLFVVL